MLYFMINQLKRSCKLAILRQLKQYLFAIVKFNFQRSNYQFQIPLLFRHCLQYISEMHYWCVQYLLNDTSIFNLKYSQMIELISDPESIQFLYGKDINLPLLKNQIDRRLLKITCMVKRLNKKRRRSLEHNRKRVEVQNKHMQTEYYGDDHFWETKEVGALREISHNQNINRQEPATQQDHKLKVRNNYPKSNKKPECKETTQKKSLNQASLTKKSEQKELVQEHQMIQSNGFTFREVQALNQGSTDRKLIQQSQDDKFFENLDFRLEISNVQMCNSIINEGEALRFRTAQLSKDISKNDTLMVSSFTDLSGSEFGKTEVSKRGNKRIRLAGGKEVILPEPERRIIVSDQCKTKMEREIEQQLSKKRKEVFDHKVRTNVLKKIEEKYGEQYSI